MYVATFAKENGIPLEHSGPFASAWLRGFLLRRVTWPNIVYRMRTITIILELFRTFLSAPSVLEVDKLNIGDKNIADFHDKLSLQCIYYDRLVLRNLNQFISSRRVKG